MVTTQGQWPLPSFLAGVWRRRRRRRVRREGKGRGRMGNRRDQTEGGRGGGGNSITRYMCMTIYSTRVLCIYYSMLILRVMHVH